MRFEDACTGLWVSSNPLEMTVFTLRANTDFFFHTVGGSSVPAVGWSHSLSLCFMPMVTPCPQYWVWLEKENVYTTVFSPDQMVFELHLKRLERCW